MIAKLRRMANEAAQAAFHALIVTYTESGIWDPSLEARWRAAEALVTMVDETYERMQLADAEAPDYFFTEDPGDSFVYPAGVGR